MRKIKFRAWDKETQQMFYGDRVPVFHEEDNGGLHSGYNDETGDWVDLTLMQFTGLLDKNGKEIYEGDIFESSALRKNRFLIVKWDINGARFIAGNNGVVVIYPQNFFRYEIIGNIYETSELLKEQ